ncbi:MAG: polyphenol oxidase family protein [Nocardioidaceae bacterium]
MFASRDRWAGAEGIVEVAFTDRHGGVSTPPYETLDLSRSRPERADEVRANFALLADELGAGAVMSMRQVHGARVEVVNAAHESTPECDALVTSVAGLALCVRVGDCVPIVLADRSCGVVAVAHAGRPGVCNGVVPAVLAAMRAEGADQVVAWVGPHICGGCYEVPAAMRAEVSALAPVAFACTTRGTPAVDIGAAVTAALLEGGCTVYDRSRCTAESADLYSYRRDGPRSGRSAGLAVIGATPSQPSQPSHG